MPASSSSLLTAVVVGIVIFGLGYVWNAFRAARLLLKGAKNTVPAMRRTYWQTLGRLIKWAVGAAIIAIALVAWTVRDVQTADPAAPAPSPSVSRR
jgi:hypothetical protein